MSFMEISVWVFLISVGFSVTACLLFPRRGPSVNTFAAVRTPESDCKTCMFNVDGGCRRFPPMRFYRADRVENEKDVTGFPVIANAPANWWCGEYRSK